MAKIDLRATKYFLSYSNKRKKLGLFCSTLKRKNWCIFFFLETKVFYKR